MEKKKNNIQPTFFNTEPRQKQKVEEKQFAAQLVLIVNTLCAGFGQVILF